MKTIVDNLKNLCVWMYHIFQASALTGACNLIANKLEVKRNYYDVSTLHLKI